MPIAVASLLSASALITLGMLAGRLLGLLRETAVAAHFGTAAAADFIIALLMIPDFVTFVFIGNAAGAALVPAFAARGREAMLALFWQAFAAGVAVFAVVGLMLYPQEAGIGELVRQQQDGAQARAALALVLASLPLAGATAIVTAYLQYHRRLLSPAFANALFNSVVLGALWLAPGSIKGLAAGVLLACLARLAAHLTAFRRAGGGWVASAFAPWQLRGALLKAYFSTAVAGMFSILPFYIPYIVIAASASGLAAFNYAFKLAMLPGMFIVTVAQLALLPWLVHARKCDGLATQALQQSRLLRLGWLVSLCTCLVLMTVGDKLAMLCFGYGKMTAEDVAEVGRLFSLGVWIMPGMVMGSIWQQIWYANEKTRGPLVASVVQSLLMVMLCMAGYRLWGMEGVMLGVVLTQTVAPVLLAGMARAQGLPVQGGRWAGLVLMHLWAISVLAALLVVVRMVDARPLAAMALAAVAIALAVGTGLAADRDVREWVKRGGRA